MRVTQKCQYALRAMLDLTLLNGEGPVKIAEIAGRQDIPPRFLESIMSELSQGGFVDSRRGAKGGYFLIRSPSKITVGEVVRFVEAKTDQNWGRSQQTNDRCVFTLLWRRTTDAVNEILDNTTLETLAEQKRAIDAEYVLDFVI